MYYLRHRRITLCCIRPHSLSLFFFFNDTATTEIYTLSLHDALPISIRWRRKATFPGAGTSWTAPSAARPSCAPPSRRSEEHTSELQSQSNLVCRLLLEKKKKPTHNHHLDHHALSSLTYVLHTQHAPA